MPKIAEGYAELHCLTNFSFLEGASHADELVTRAAELGLAALAVTDRNTLAGVVRAHVAAKEAGLKLLIGAQVTPIDAGPVLLWTPDRQAYGRLARLLTLGRRAAPKGACHIRFDDLASHSDGLLAGVLVAREAGGGWRVASDGWVSPATRHPPPATRFMLQRYHEVFGDRCYAVAELHRGPEDRRLLEQFMLLSKQAAAPLIAGNDVHYHVPQRRPLQDVLTAIRHRCTVAELGERIFPNGERYLKSAAEMTELFADCPQAVARTVEVAQRCRFSLDELRYEYPEELCPAGTTAFEHLLRLTWQGADQRYPQGVPAKVRGLIEHELKLIEELRYEAYFLTVWDLVRFARSRGILCQGRGSAANSAVCFCLGITSVDPDRIDVLFERFVSKERDEAPDIDVDFEHERREEVLQYLYAKYGRERAGLTAEVISYRPRSAVRDAGKALGLPLDVACGLALVGERETASGPTGQLARLTAELIGFPRHLGQHVGGMVITQGPLCELVPIENAAMADRTVVQWDKDDLDALGILKVDILALGMLTAIRKCFALIAGHRPLGSEYLTQGLEETLTLATIPAEDPAVYQMIARADTMGVFQIESRAQMSMLPRLKPRCFYDLVIEVALVRPGPIQGDMVHPYLRRRAGQEAVEYPDERIRGVVEKTLGVPIFQEQAMRLAVVAAGFTPGEADQLRRAMGAWRRRGVMEAFHRKFVQGMTANGYSEEFAQRLFRQIQGFGDYGFPESHAASFALLVYVSAWLKYYYPAEFAAALINSQPLGFYGVAQLVADARKHGVEIRPIDVNFSAWDCTLERVAGDGWRVAGEDQPSSATPQPPPATRLALRLGLRLLAGLSSSHAERIVAERKRKGFSSFEDFVERTMRESVAGDGGRVAGDGWCVAGENQPSPATRHPPPATRLQRHVLIKLAQGDAFQSLGLKRRQALWLAMTACEPLPLFERMEEDVPAAVPAMSSLNEVVSDYGAAGLTLREHPVHFLRPMLDKILSPQGGKCRGVVRAGDLKTLPSGCEVAVAGIVLLRQRPSTAKGTTFVTLEDETGMANLIVWQSVWERYRRIACSAGLLLAHGQLQKEAEVIHVIVSKLEDLSGRLAGLPGRSRDFR